MRYAFNFLPFENNPELSVSSSPCSNTKALQDESKKL
jgi:hypothetical protein